MKINGSNDEMLRAAAEQFGDKTVDEVMFSKLPHLKHLYKSQLFNRLFWSSGHRYIIRIGSFGSLYQNLSEGLVL